MNMTTVNSIQMIPIMSISLPVMRGEMADRIRTWATSSMTMMKMMVSISA